MEGLQFIRHNDTLFGMVIRQSARVETTRFFSPDDSPLRFGLLAHNKGFVEPAHHHKQIPRTIVGLQQMFVVQRRSVASDHRRGCVACGRQLRWIGAGILDTLEDVS